MASLSPYGKFNEADEYQEMLMARRKTRKRIAIISLSSIVLVAVIIGAVVGVTQGNKNGGGSGQKGTSNTISSAIRTSCSATLYPESCYTSISALAKSGNLKPQDIFKLSVQVALNELTKVSDSFPGPGDLEKLNVTEKMAYAALESCHELLSLAIDHLNSSFSLADTTFIQAFGDLRTWLSSAGTYQDTCLDGIRSIQLDQINLPEKLKSSTEFVSNSLALVTSLESTLGNLGLGLFGGSRRLLEDDGPSWLSSVDRKLLQAKPGYNAQVIKADAVVAKDGSGKYKTIGAALKAVPEKSDKKFVIYVKKGIYVENVRIEKYMWNVVMIGDGKSATIVSGSLNVVDGTPTFQSATFAVFGKGFVGRDMGFRNTAGPSKHQAVALMASADLCVFHRCAMDGYQDTLYVHANRQFYRECDIIGTVDFIFGNSAVVLQRCQILPRKPMAGQQNTITAQGKVDPNQNTGISIQNCTVAPFGNLAGVKTYLGRPWKNYSTTIFMQSTLGSLIDPKGWLPWVGTTAPNTIFYAEFQNYGPGAVTKYRVNWKGLKLSLVAKMVERFTVTSFLGGNVWLPPTGVEFKPTL